MRAQRPLDLALVPESDLVERARAGDRGAFRAIMERCNQRLFRIARGVMRDEGEAEDVLQEAYVRAFAAIGGFRGEAGIATWLTRIVLNEAHRRLRLRRTRPTAELDELDSRVVAFPGRIEDPEADAARGQIRRILEQAVDQLPEPFRLVFILREVEELSVEETAEHLGLKPQTVKTRLHRARHRLRAALDARLGDVMVGAYPFLGARCERITGRVLARMFGEPAGTPAAATPRSRGSRPGPQRR